MTPKSADWDYQVDNINRLSNRLSKRLKVQAGCSSLSFFLDLVL